MSVQVTFTITVEIDPDEVPTQEQLSHHLAHLENECAKKWSIYDSEYEQEEI